MKWLCLMLVLLIMPLLAQGEGAAVEAPKPDSSRETEDQKNAREVSLVDLKDAEAHLDSEREAVTKRERRLSLLVESLENQNQAITAKEETIKKLLKDYQDKKEEVSIPEEQVAHWDARDPVVAARDFILLYQKEPTVAVAIITKMKKKKSASLVDEVSKLSGGKEIAALLHEAIGTGVIKE